MGKSWRYHPDHEAEIFDDSELEELEKQGWVDTPDKFPKEDITDLTQYTKNQLERYALEAFGVDLDKRKNKTNMILDIEALQNDSITTD